MINILDVVDPGVENTGSSMNPFVIVGILVGLIVIVAVTVIIANKKNKGEKK